MQSRGDAYKDKITDDGVECDRDKKVPKFLSVMPVKFPLFARFIENLGSYQFSFLFVRVL